MINIDNLIKAHNNKILRKEEANTPAKRVNAIAETDQRALWETNASKTTWCT